MMAANNVLASVLVSWLLLVPSSQASPPQDLQEGGTDGVSRNLTGRRRRGDSRRCGTSGDDALDPNTPHRRATEVRRKRNEEAEREHDGSRNVCQIANGNREADGSPLLMAKFHKTLPHDSLGQVDPDAFAALQDCAFSGDFDTCEAIPAGGSNAFLINPLGGLPVDMSGPAGSAVAIPPMSELHSPKLNLAAMPGFSLAEMDVPMNPDGPIDPEMHLFRSSFMGVDKGSIISQVEAKMSTFIPGVDYLTDYDSWLLVQNGAAPPVVEERDPVIRYIHNRRNLSTLVFTDMIYTRTDSASKGEINELASNVALGRGVMGSHYRMDGTEGTILGETIAVQLLHREVMQLAEDFDLEFNLLRENTIKLFQDGTLSIDGELCAGEMYRGVENC